MIYDRIKSEYDNLCRRIEQIQKDLSHLPEGKLICSHHNKHSKWYLTDGHLKTYIPKSNRSLAEQLAHKKYLSFLLDDLEKEKRALSLYLHHHPSTSKSTELLTAYPAYQELLAPAFTPLSQELAHWMNSPYEKNPKHPETLIHKGIANTYLRSKSEVMIDMLLRRYNIPFRYECALQLGNSVFYPDFTLRHPYTGTFHYWEHFGMMDSQPYIDQTSSKINLYSSNGIIPGIQLITTFETKNHPLDPELVENLIKYHFL